MLETATAARKEVNVEEEMALATVEEIGAATAEEMMVAMVGKLEEAL